MRAGVLASGESTIAARRLRTLEAARLLDPLPVTDDVAATWAELRVWLRGHGRSMRVNDSRIAATALTHDLAVVTWDADYDDVMDLRVVHV